MPKTFDTLIPDIYSLFEQDIEHIDIGISHTEHQSRNTLRMSNIGRPLRQLYYDLTGQEGEKLTSQIKFKFQYGHFLEDALMALATRAGHEVTDRQREVELDGVLGHIDGIIDGVLVDVKSASPQSYKKFENGSLLGDDPFGYCDQLSSYWACLPEVERAGFLAIDKVSGKICFHELDKNKKKDRDAISKRISQINDMVAGTEEPERCYSTVPEGKAGNERLGVGCSYCAHKFHCWRDSNDGQGLKVYTYSTGPKFFTKVVKEPRVDKVEYDSFTIKE